MNMENTMVDFTKKKEENMPHSSIKFGKPNIIKTDFESKKKLKSNLDQEMLNDMLNKKLADSEIKKSTISGFKKNNIFDADDNPVIKNILSYIETNYNQIYCDHKILLTSITKKIISPTSKLIESWGEDVLVEQKELVQTSVRRIAEFNSLDANKLLNDVIDSCDNKKHSFINKFVKANKPSYEEYTLKVNALKVHLDGLSDSIDECIKNCKLSKLPIYLSVLSAYAENNKNLPDDLDQSIFNRRRLLQQALQNIEIACAQLEQIKSMISNAKNEASHILNVTLPSLSMININK